MSKIENIGGFNIETRHSGILTASTAVAKIAINWKPDFWVVVARATSGQVIIYPQSDRSSIAFWLDRGTVRVPMHNDVFTIETVAFSGWYSLYAVRNLDGFEVEA